MLQINIWVIDGSLLHRISISVGIVQNANTIDPLGSSELTIIVCLPGYRVYTWHVEALLHSRETGNPCANDGKVLPAFHLKAEGVL